MIETHPLMLDEIFAKANDSDDVVKTLIPYLSRHFVREYLNQCVNDIFVTFDTDTVEFTNYGYHRSMSGAFLLNRQTWNIVSTVILGKTAEATKKKQFKALSEMLYKEEAEILDLIINKNITKKYPNITHEKICEVLNVSK